MVNQDKILKLELVQVSGIIKLILEKCEIDLLELRINSMKDVEVRDVKKAIGHFSRKDLIELIKICPEIDDNDIDLVYEQYRYGLKPGFILCYLGAECKDIDKAELETKICEKLNTVNYAEDAQYKNVKFKGIESISMDTSELAFSFLSKHSYITEKENPDYVYEYKETFVWISTSGGYLAIKSAPSKIIFLLKRIMGDVFRTNVISVCLTKQMINKIFGNNKIKRGTYFKPNANNDEAQKVTIADANLAEKPNVREAYGDYDMTSSSLEENINDDISSTLGINCKQGKIYLSKNMSASELRTWSLKRIKDIMHYIKDATLESQEAFDIMNPLEHGSLDSFSITQKKEIVKILFCVYCMRKHSLDSYHILCTSGELLYKCDKHFLKYFFSESDDEHDEGIPSCTECGATNFAITKSGRVTCLSCGEQQEGKYVFEDEQGNEQRFLGVERFLALFPDLNLKEAIWNIMGELYSIDMSGYDSFYICDGHLTLIRKKASGGKILVKELKELKCISEIALEKSERESLLEKYKSIKEKCSAHSNDACSVCSYDNRKCIMSLFTCFDFRPNPHQNSEFGDVNFWVTYKGEKRTLVGIAKSKNSADTLTTSSKAAREMIQQVLTMSHDARVDIIAVICPMRFHPQLENEIEYIAKLTGKKVVYFDDEFMARLLKYDYLNRQD
ncbi:MAG: hypothetical protein HDT39_06080 [Lachnospiraceae bacterium]|nr:hypothetical protein [Lachnospiraceae bacterium]